MLTLNNYKEQHDKLNQELFDLFLVECKKFLIEHPEVPFYTVVNRTGSICPMPFFFPGEAFVDNFEVERLINSNILIYDCNGDVAFDDYGQYEEGSFAWFENMEDDDLKERITSGWLNLDDMLCRIEQWKLSGFIEAYSKLNYMELVFCYLDKDTGELKIDKTCPYVESLTFSDKE